MPRVTAPKTKRAPKSSPSQGTPQPSPSRQAVFARHETFAPRHGWLIKGYRAAVDDSAVFLADDAAVRLGVGKNMVRSIRYWCHAFKLLVEAPDPKRRAMQSVPTELGRRLLSERGWDPYLEDPGSLWLVHWHLLQSPCLATAWEFALGHFPLAEFTGDEFGAGLKEFVRKEYPDTVLAESSIAKDVSCFLRTYAEDRDADGPSEDSIRSPFAELGLVRSGVRPRSYQFDAGPKRALSSALIVACCLWYAEKHAGPARTISLARLLRQPGSPGAAFRLTDHALYDAIDEITAQDSSISLTDAGGLVQLSFTREPAALGWHLAESHYSGVSGRSVAR